MAHIYIYTSFIQASRYLIYLNGLFPTLQLHEKGSKKLLVLSIRLDMEVQPA